MSSLSTVNLRRKPGWRAAASAVVCAWMILAPAAPSFAQSQVPAGTRFLVELRDKLDARKVRVGKKFEARTVEPLVASDGSTIPAWTKIRGEVSYVRDNQMILRFERIETRRGKEPLVATVTHVVGEKDVKENAGDEGEIKSSSHRGRNAAIGAVVLGGIGAAVGGASGGGKGAAIGAAAGGAGGAAIGAASGGKDLILYQGTRLELQLDRPLEFRSR